MEEPLVFNELKNLRQDLAAIREFCQDLLDRYKVKDEAFERLYAELDRLKQRTSAIDNKPLYIDLILLHDRMVAACGHATDESNQVMLSLREELGEIMQRRDIHLIPTADDTFNPQFQKVVGMEDMASSENNGKVLKVLRDGFSCGELVIRPQEVVIARLPPTAL